MRRIPFWMVVSLLAACKPGGQAIPETTEAPSSERILRRLSRAEYDATVRDLLGIDSRWGQSLPPDEVVEGFDNNARALRVGPLLMDRLLQAAEEIADAVADNLIRSCSVAERGELACARQLIERLGPRAWRQPMAPSDKERYLALYQEVAAAGGHPEGVRAVLSALLLSPHFLYRSELGVREGDLYRLTPYEVASELSYLLWGSMPDEPLLARAAAGGLRTPEQIAQEAQRLLASPRVRAQLDRFLGQWLQIDRLAVVPRDEVQFPMFTSEMRAALRAETSELFFQTVRSGGSLQDLLLANHTYVDERLARFYGLTLMGGPRTDSGLVRVALPPERGGLLGQGSVLATHATPRSGSPIHRGKLVREQLLCQTLPPPPPGLMVQLPEGMPGQTNRERFALHASATACSSCHRLMDPIGFGLEHFDAVGRYRSTEEGKPIDARGEIVALGGETIPFDGLRELQQRLAERPEVHDCYARQWIRFAFGVDGAEEQALAAEAAERVRSVGLAELLVQLTQLRRFTHRRPDDAVAPDVPPPPADSLPEPPAAPPASPYVAEMRRDADWPTGYCTTVTVTNRGPLPGAWEVLLVVEGTINNLWNARSEPAGKALRFRGMEYNRTLEPGASTSFGFCAQK
ncbi:MAG: DUF1592 domain-containing protein [Myxococcales bacterium]|nr:DUF1592 domain-containing protein [Myxococcota bacterium]MDW8282666.1 DUF1592 domain-containing protein [Myxococcales bacterium]